MKMRRLNFICFSVIGIALVIGFGNLSAANKVLSDADLASLWGGSAQGCDRDGCCKCGNKDCTDIDCEIAGVYYDGSIKVKRCTGLSPSASVHDCWLTSNLDDDCKRELPINITGCEAICFDTEDCTGSPTVTDVFRYNSACN